MRGVKGGVLVVAAWLLVAAPPALAAPPNDNFASAQQITLEAVSATATGSNVDATSEPGEPSHGAPFPGHSIWFTWRAPTSGQVIVDGCGSAIDTTTRVYTGDHVASLQLAPSSNFGGYGAQCSPGQPPPPGYGPQFVSFQATAGVLYRIAFDGRDGQTGNIKLTLWRPPDVTAEDVSVPEGHSAQTDAAFNIALTQPAPRPISIYYSTKDNTAFAPTDYQQASGFAEFAPGETVKPVAVRVNGDSEDEFADENFFFDLGYATNFARITDRTAIGWIVNDDVPPPRPPGCFDWGCPFPGFGPLRMSTSGDRSELVKSIPITRHGSERPVMRIEPGELGAIAPGDTIETSAEVEISVTCLTKGSRCVGSRYGYDPLVNGRLTIGPSGGGTKRTVVDTGRLRCSQTLPHRNHHCVLVFAPERTEFPAGCEACDLELLLSARHKRARGGNRLVVGSDSHAGVEDDRGRLNATIVSADAPEPQVEVERRRARGSVPVAGRTGNAPKRVVYSARLDDLDEFEQVAVDARSLIRTSQLPYGTFIGSQLVLAEGPTAVNSGPQVRRAALLQGEMTEKNGFNCTRGRSAHDNPCEISKFGLVRMRKAVKGALYVNLVVELGARWGGRYSKGDKARVLDRGSLRATRYGPLGWVRVVPLP